MYFAPSDNQDKAHMKSTFLAAVTLSLSAGAFAQSDYSITYTQSELTSAAKVEALYDRIQKTARKNCPSYSLTRDLSARPKCIAEITQKLVESIDNPSLTAIARGEDSNMDLATRD
jgi:UrcA family protein